MQYTNNVCPSPCPSPTCGTLGTNGLPTWCHDEKSNTNWLVGCDYTGTVIDPTNTNLNPATGAPYAALFTANPDGTYGGTYNAATGTSSGGTTVPYTPFKCPPTYTSIVDCSDRCGDGIYDGLVYFGDFGR
jgi:hypothetical protein